MSQQQVRILYKVILRLHRALPTELKEMGDMYVKDEFRRHTKTSDNKQYLNTFPAEWTKIVGESLSTKLNHLADDQLYQLYELKQAIESPEQNPKESPQGQGKSSS